MLRAASSRARVGLITVPRALFSSDPAAVKAELDLPDTARSAVLKSCYLNIDFRIPENTPVYTAVERMAQHHIGCLAVTEGSDPKGKIIGVLSERDYLCKVALLGKSSKDISVSEICTQGAANLVVVNHDDPIDACMKKLLSRDIRHLLIRGESGEIDSMLSVKDLVKVVLARHNAVVQKLTDFALGQKSYYKK